MTLNHAVATLNDMSPLVALCDVGLRSSSVTSTLPSISEPSLSLVLPSDPVDVVDDVESLPDTFGFASAVALLYQSQTTYYYHYYPQIHFKNYTGYLFNGT